MYKKIVMGIVMFIVLLALIKLNYTETIEEAMEKSNVNYEKILLKKETDQGIVVFYDHLGELNVGLIEKKLVGYDWIFGIGTADFDSDRDSDYGFGNIGKSSKKGDEDTFILGYGTLSNPDIEKIQLKYIDDTYDFATIIESEEGRFWYQFLDNEIDKFPKVIGLTQDNKIVFGQ